MGLTVLLMVFSHEVIRIYKIQWDFILDFAKI